MYGDRDRSEDDARLVAEHGRLVDIKPLAYLEAIDKQECVLVFADGFETPAVQDRNTVEQIARALAAQRTQQFNPHAKFDTGVPPPPTRSYQSHNNQPSPTFQRTSHDDYADRLKQLQRTRGNKAPQRSAQQSLSDFGKQNTGRSKILNGKLFTKTLLTQTQRGAIPDALK